MDKKMSNNGLLIRAQALVLVSLMIVAGSIAMTPAVFASEGGNNEILTVTELVGPSPIQVDVTQSTSPICYAGSKISVLQIDITDLGGAPDTFNTLMVQYTGTNPADVQAVGSAELWFDVDANGIYNPAIDMPIAPTNIAGGMFLWGGLGQPVLPAPAPTRTYWVLIQVDNAATVGNIVDAMIVPGGIGFLSGFSNIAPMDPNDAPDFCTIQAPLASPQPIYGYVTAADLTTPIPGIAVTVTEAATGETIGAITDANGRYEVDLNDLLLGYTDGDLLEASTLAPNQAYNSAIYVAAGPPNLWNISLIVDATVPTSSVSIVPAANNTGTWNVDFVYDDALVNGYASGVYSVDIYVETPATPGVYNYWTGQIDGAFTGTEIYTPVDGEGFYNFYSLATDYAGNVEAVPGVLPDDGIIYDITAPTAAVDGPLTSDVQAFTVTYTMNDPAPASGVANASLWWTFDGGASWAQYGDDAATGSFNVDVSVLMGDGTYGWYTAAWDIAGNYEPFPPALPADVEFSTLVDSTDPIINATTVDKLYINNHGTFGGTPPPVSITTSLWDENLVLGSVGIRSNNSVPDGTMYVTYNATIDGYTNVWNGNWYLIDGTIVTASFDDDWGTDIKVFGDLNGALTVGDIVGNVIPDYYALFNPAGLIQDIYATQGTTASSDDVSQGLAVGDTFMAFSYVGGTGFVAVVSHTDTTGGNLVLASAPAADGQYAVIVTAVDALENSHFSNEDSTPPNPVITVDNFAPDADATITPDSTVFAFDVNYLFTEPAPSSGVQNVTLWYQKDGGGWNLYGDDPSPEDGLFPVDVTAFGEGTYDWFMISYDMAENHDPFAFAIEATTIVDSTDPIINATTVDKLYINNHGTFGGTPPPVSITTSLWDENLVLGSVGIRSNNSVPDGTMYVTYNATIDGYTNVWNGNWYLIDGTIVTASFDDDWGTDIKVFGDLNGALTVGDIVGNVIPDYYALFNPAGLIQDIYATQGTTASSDDVSQGLAVGDTFMAFSYVGGTGFVAVVSHTDTTGGNLVLASTPAADGQYAVIVTAVDALENSHFTNEDSTPPNPVITVDNFAPDADATGPATSTLAAFDVTYAFTDVVAPNGATPLAIVNVTLWYSFNAGAWTLYGDDATPGDGLFPVDTSTLSGEGTYDWFIVSYDLADNHESHVFAIEATTIVDSIAPVIGVTSVDKLYINTEGTYLGTPPPVQIDTSVVEANLMVASIGIRNTNTAINGTFYVSYNFTAGAATFNWNGHWYFLQDGATYELVTATFSDFYADTFIWGEYNGASAAGAVIGQSMPSHYLAYDAGMVFQGLYETQGTLALGDDVLIVTAPGDNFRPYHYEGGIGYIAGDNTYPVFPGNPVLFSQPIIDGGYATVIGAVDVLGNSAYTNELDGNPIITVDNIQPTVTTEVALTIDVNGNTYIDTGDTIVGWVNVTDLNEDLTCAIVIDVDEFTIPDQAVVGPVYIGGGSWQFTYVVQGPPLTVSNIDVDFRDLAGNQILALDNATFDIYGSFSLNYIAGWNLISIPLLNPMVGGVPLAAADDLATQGALMVSKWDFAGQRYINYIPGFHTAADPQNFAIIPDEAYWAWMPAPGSMNIDGERPGVRIMNVGPGWNMVGYTNPSAGDVDTDWAPQVSCGAYDDIAYYNGVTFVHYHFSGTVMALSPGRGYFVWSDGAATITYGS